MEEEEIATRLLAHLHMSLDSQFPHTKAGVSDAFKETAFSIVEDTISDGEPKPTEGVPETRDSTPITKSSTKVGNDGGLQNLRKHDFSNYNKELGENTQFSLDEPTQGNETDEAMKSSSVITPLINRLLILFILILLSVVAYFYMMRNS